MRNVSPFAGSVGRQRGWPATHEVGSVWSRPMKTSATMRPATAPGRSSGTSAGASGSMRMARATLSPDGSFQVRCRGRLRCGSEGGRVVARDRAEGQVEERRRDLGVELLVRLHLAIAEVEERLPADEPARRTTPAAQVGGIGHALLRRVEDEGEERLTVACPTSCGRNLRAAPNQW